MYTITLIPGDGIGPEVVEAAKICIESTGVGVEWQVFEAGSRCLEKYGCLFQEGLIDSIRRNKVALKGPIITPVGRGYRSLNVTLRQELDLFVCLRPAKSYEGVHSFYRDVDIIIFRENTEDLYSGVEFKHNSQEAHKLIESINSISERKIRFDSSISIKPISVYGSERICRFAFEYALKHGRKKVACVHKANIMKYTDGLFLEKFYEVAKDYPQIQAQDYIVDNLCMQLVKNPKNFDCLVLPNLYGDIVSDLCAGLVGGLGVAPGANLSREIGLFEPVHGSAPKYAGKNKVNPTATILSGVLMLRFLGEEEKANILEEAVSEVIREGKFVTYDLKPHRDDPNAVGTLQMAQEIARRVRKRV